MRWQLLWANQQNVILLRFKKKRVKNNTSFWQTWWKYGFWFLYHFFSFFICGIILISLWLHHRDMLKNKMFFTLKESKSLKVPSGRMILLMVVFLPTRLIHAFYCQLITYFIMSKSYIRFWVFEHFIWKMYVF